MRNFLSALLSIFILTNCVSERETKKTESDMITFFVGTYTKKEGHVDGIGKGVYVYEMNRETGEINQVSISDAIVNPSFVAVHPNGKWLYAVNEYEGREDGFSTISALKYDQVNGSLKLVNVVSSLGLYPCHIIVDNSGKFIMAANYEGNVVLAAIAEDGSLKEPSSEMSHEGGTSHPRQTSPHAHQIVQHPKTGNVYSVDLGADKIYQYNLNSTDESLETVAEYKSVPEMSGPRHMVFHPTLSIAYIINELNGTVEVANIDGSMTRNVQTISTLAVGDDRDAVSAAIKVHPNGKFLYSSNRGTVNEIAIYKIDQKGLLTNVGYQSTLGDAPRDFSIDPSGKFMLVANQNSRTIVTFKIDGETGQLRETGLIADVPSPVCIQFLN